MTVNQAVLVVGAVSIALSVATTPGTIEYE